MFAHATRIAGHTAPEVLFLYGTSTLSFAMADVLLGAAERLGRHITDGDAGHLAGAPRQPADPDRHGGGSRCWCARRRRWRGGPGCAATDRREADRGASRASPSRSPCAAGRAGCGGAGRACRRWTACRSASSRASSSATWGPTARASRRPSRC
ncbi:hypothetical protein [Actinomadura keratinilytica]